MIEQQPAARITRLRLNPRPTATVEEETDVEAPPPPRPRKQEAREGVPREPSIEPRESSIKQEPRESSIKREPHHERRGADRDTGRSPTMVIIDEEQIPAQRQSAQHNPPSRSSRTRQGTPYMFGTVRGEDADIDVSYLHEDSHPAPNLRDQSHPQLFRNIRDWDGTIVGHISMEDVRSGRYQKDTSTLLPSLGKPADYYLVAHGYSNEMIHEIYDLYSLNQANREAFIAALMEHGVPLHEAQFLHWLVRKPEVFATYVRDL